MKRIVLFFLGGLILSQAAGCAVLQPSDQSVAWRLQSLEEGFLESRENQRRAMARMDELEQRMAALEAAVQRLSGGMPMAESLPEEPMPEQPMDGQGQVSTELNPVLGPEEPMDATTPADAEQPMDMAEPEVDSKPVMAGPESGEDKPWAQVPGETGQTQAAAQPKPVFQSQSGPQQLYKKALDLTLNDQPAKARPLFQEFLKKYPQNALAPNALYWLGETYYAEKDYTQAILAFKDVTTKYPEHAKASAALLKIGMSYRNMGDVDNAMFYLRTLVDEHPNTEPARLARQVLNELAG